MALLAELFFNVEPENGESELWDNSHIHQTLKIDAINA